MKVAKPIQEAQDIIYTIMRSYKLNEIASKICATLYLSPEPICLDMLAEQTGYSLASISNSVKFLTNFFLVEKVKKPGSKKVYVQAKRSTIALLETKTKLALQTEVEPIKDKYPQLIKDMKPFAKKNKHYKNQLDLLKTQYEDTLKLEELLTEFVTIIKKVKEK